MKILVFCSQPFTKADGTPKVFLEFTEAIREFGWDCDLLGTSSFTSSYGLPEYLREHAQKYDVVDYDREWLPYPRHTFCPSTLFVARSALLTHHLEHNPIPTAKTLRGIAGYCIKGRSRRAEELRRVQGAVITIQEADVANVSNQDDRRELMRRGISPQKILVLPYGIHRDRRLLFNAVSSQPPEQHRVAFVGTFDQRKGASDLPKILRQIAHSVKGVKFRLLGTVNKSEKEILACFDRNLRSQIEIICRYLPQELPELLASCSIGIFPSYLEGFPFGVLEMLAASVPVVAYQAPGAPEMLTPDLLVPKGDTQAMSQKVIDLLQSPTQLQDYRHWAKENSQQFAWDRIAQATAEAYEKHLCLKRSAAMI